MSHIAMKLSSKTLVNTGFIIIPLTITHFSTQLLHRLFLFSTPLTSTFFNQKHCTPSIFKGLGKKPERRRKIKTQLLTGNTDEENESFLPSFFTFFFKKALETQRFQGLEGNWEEEGDEEDFTGSSSVVDGIGKKRKDPGRKEEEALLSQGLIFLVVIAQQKL